MVDGRARYGCGVGVLLLALVLAACGGGSAGSEASVAPQEAVDTASAKCSTLPEFAADPAALTQCLVAELAADCDAGAHYCDDATGLMPPLAGALAQFCLVDPVLTEIVPGTLDCVRSGMAWGCPGLGFLLVELADCLVDQFGSICELPGSAPLQVCQRHDFVASLEMQDRMALLTPLSASFAAFCADETSADCVQTGLSAFCAASPRTAPPFCAGGVLNLPATLSPDLAERLCGVTGLSALLVSACGS